MNKVYLSLDILSPLLTRESRIILKQFYTANFYYRVKNAIRCSKAAKFGTVLNCFEHLNTC